MLQSPLVVNLNPIAFEIGPIAVRWYGISYALGLLFAWRYLSYFIVKRPINALSQKNLDDLLIWCLLGVVVGGRLGYVFFYNFDYYLNTPLEILKTWEGGMAFHGGALGVIIAMIIYAKHHHLSPLLLVDLTAMTAPVGVFFGRIANFINGELYGRITDAPWGMIFPQGGPFVRHPSQLYEAFSEGLLLFLLLNFFAWRKKWIHIHGFITALGLTGYGLARFVCEFFRELDPGANFYATYFTKGQLLSLPMILGGILMLWYLNAHSRKA